MELIHLKIFFCSGTTTKMLFQSLKNYKKWFIFITRTKLTCSNLDVFFQIWQIFWPFYKMDRVLSKKTREFMTGGPSIVFRRRAVADKNFIRVSSNIGKSFVGTNASQLYPFSMCQDIPIGLYTRCEFFSEI